MLLNDILKKLEEVAPVSLSDEFCKKYGMYDNSGIILDMGADITGAIFSLDLSKEAIQKAKSRSFNLIITHHPAIYGGVSHISADDPIAECIRSGISVISMHLNFDAAPKGIDYHLMRGLGGNEAKILAPVTGGGYGRVFAVNPVVFSDYVRLVKQNLSTERAISYGAKDKTVKKVASFCGAGCDDKAIAFAIDNAADVFVSSDLKHHEIAFLLSKGINVIQLTHYSAESYGFGKIYSENLCKSLQIPTALFCDTNLI